MSSESAQCRAADAIRRIQVLLDETQMQATIDDPIDEALATQPTAECPASPRQLIGHVAKAVQDLFACLPAAGRRLTEAQARDEAAALIARCTTDDRGVSFEAALLEVLDDQLPGIEVLYRRLGEHLKAELRQAYVTCVFARHLDPADWNTNLAAAGLLLEQIQADLPEGAPTLRPEQCVDCIPELFFAVQRAQSATMSLLSDRFQSAP